MTMNDVPALLLAWVIGVALGAVFFLGLWWTVRVAVLSKVPALWFCSSVLLRMSLVVAGFYFVFGGHWERLLLCLLGFTMARYCVQTVTRFKGETKHRKLEVMRHAP